jgi:hypothetical protein
VAEVRVALRQVRRAHSDRTLGELLTDVYLVGFIAILYGGGGAVAIRRHLASPLTGPPGDAAVRAWLAVALLLVLTALAWHGLRAVGPLVTTPAVQSWVLATPVDRAGWLRVPLIFLLAGSTVAGAALGLLAAWAGGANEWWAVVAGAGAGVALAAAAVTTQASPPRAAERRLAAGLLAAGLALLTAVVVARYQRTALVVPGVPGWALAAAAAGAAVWLTPRARMALVHLDRAALGGGAQLAEAAVTAAVMLDPSLLSGILTTRRWRLAGTVHSRRLWRGPRWWVLLQADVVRQLRRRADVLAYAALVLTPYAVSVFAPVATGPARIVAGYLAVDRLAGGLRAVARTPGLRRMLGGSDSELRLIHLVVPAVGLVLWWAATSWAGPAPGPTLTVVLILGLLGAVYRTATRPPMSYDSDISDSPMGPVPTSLIRKVLRGPDVVALLVLVDLLVSSISARTP